MGKSDDQEQVRCFDSPHAILKNLDASRVQQSNVTNENDLHSKMPCFQDWTKGASSAVATRKPSDGKVIDLTQLTEGYVIFPLSLR